MKHPHILLSLCILFIYLGNNVLAQDKAYPIADAYHYAHSWSYAIGTDSIACTEVGEMIFREDGTALDHAIQKYSLLKADGTQYNWEYDYYSPSYWRLEDREFLFRGDSATFCMKLLTAFDDLNIEKTQAEWLRQYARKTAENVHRSIGREIRFVLSELSQCCLEWSYTYPDGHTDTWLFERDTAQ